ncbi:(d)CMP kinase [Candidatus Pelagibacter communis]|uniref:(d)CMP kinase n=1 Tax=Pelagibacter ubique TaxID=198252 RepID=UPI00094BFD18|nr:(d)CMP kinase [Candidatus Pelagibacter ubique]
MIKKIKVAIDSPAAAGAGTVAKAISKYFNLLYLDTGKIYRYIAFLKIKFPGKYSYKFIKRKIKGLKLKDLERKVLLNDDISTIASIIAKDKKVRKLVHNFQISCAYRFPKKFNGSCLDGRDITYRIIPDANFKFFITASLKVRAIRRYRELRKLGKKTTLKDVKKSIKTRDYSDYNRRISPLKRTKDSILINTSNLTKSACFLKIKNIIEKETKN